MAKTVRQGVALNWDVGGDPEEIPLLLLHSIGTDVHLWDRAVPYLGCAAAIRDMDIHARLPTLAVPIPTVAGYPDISTPSFPIQNDIPF